MKIEYSRGFIKDYKHCPDNIKNNFKLRLRIFIKDIYNPILNNHSLLGKLAGYRSINISGDWRAIFQDINNGEIAYFIAIGTHSKLYK